MKVKTKVSSLEIDSEQVLAAVLRSDAYRKRVEKYARDSQAELQAIGQSFYESAVDGANELLQEGLPNASSARRRISVRMPGGRGAYASVAWMPLSPKWLAEKAHRASSKYHGKRRSHGAGRFWLDTGKLRTAFGSKIPVQAKAKATATPVRIGKGQWLVTFTLQLKEITPRFLDSALRRALLQGADPKQRAVGLVDMVAMPRGKRLQGVYRAAWTEAYRPLMRPLAMRLGQAMQQQILKTLKRR